MRSIDLNQNIFALISQGATWLKQMNASFNDIAQFKEDMMAGSNDNAKEVFSKRFQYVCDCVDSSLPDDDECE